MPLVTGRSAWCYLRWWVAALVACVSGFASLWLPLLFEGDGAVGCAGYNPLPPGLSALWPDLERMWLDLRQALHLVERWVSYAWNLLPSTVALLGGVLNVWTGRRFGNAIGLLAALCVAVVALDWAFWSFSYLMMLNCGGWDGRVLWLLWRMLPMVCYATAVGLLIKAIRARRQVPASTL
ncbi:hypothetical protein [Sphaerimonospora mesophila]|uniref:hypothetical protein n=1 Tax=Sphaerimonospora mesophila TaxID=37483 RepID=UPI0006E20F68